jgi:hypothetical protein
MHAPAYTNCTRRDETCEYPAFIDNPVLAVTELSSQEPYDVVNQPERGSHNVGNSMSQSPGYLIFSHSGLPTSLSSHGYVSLLTALLHISVLRFFVLCWYSIVTVYGVTTPRVPCVLSWHTFLCSVSTFHTRIYRRYVM